MIARHDTETRPVLVPSAVYWSDNGRRVCASCAGASALYTGHDLSGQPVARATRDDAAEWERTFGRPLDCETGCTRLSTVAGPDGWPLAREGRRP